MIGLVLGFLAGIEDAVPVDRGPQGTIRADGVNGVALGISIGLVFWFMTRLGFRTAFGAMTELLFGADVRLGVGPEVALAAGLAAGLTVVMTGVWTRYHVAVAVMALRRRGRHGSRHSSTGQRTRDCCACLVSATSSGTGSCKTG